jgi:hypothetical protein
MSHLKIKTTHNCKVSRSRRRGVLLYASLRLDVLRVIFTFIDVWRVHTWVYCSREFQTDANTAGYSHLFRACCSAFLCTSLLTAGLQPRRPRHFSWVLQRGSHKPDGRPTSVTWFQLLRKQNSTGTSTTLTAETHWSTRTLPTCNISLVSLTLPVLQSGDSVELILL